MRGIIVIILLLLVINVAVGAICWPYSINTWLDWAGSPNAGNVVWWHGALLSFVPAVGQLALPAAAVTFIGDLFIE